jgi:hypothetical protein
MRLSCFLSLAALGAAGCGTGYALGAAQAKPLVLMHAEDDLDCSEKDLRLEEEWGGRWEATGCGRSAVYNAKCMGIQCDVVPAGSAVPWADSPTYDIHASH